MTEPRTMAGGCMCGAARFEARIADDTAYLCHCRMCQRATGGVSIAFTTRRKDAVRWIGEQPDWYASSPIAHRPFCSRCGTPLGFAYPDSEKMDLTIGSFDDPSRFEPKYHFAAESIHEAWIDTSALPRHRADEYEALNRRWMKTVGKLPD